MTVTAAEVAESLATCLDGGYLDSALRTTFTVCDPIKFGVGVGAYFTATLNDGTKFVITVNPV